MDGQKFDALIMTVSQALTRRGLMRFVSSGAVTLALTEIEPAFARRKGKKHKGHKKGRQHGQGACAQLNGGCDARQACCQGFECIGKVCSCPAGTVASGGACVAAPPPPPPPSPPPPPECVNDNDCGNNEECQAGFCVPEHECIVDDDCANNEACQDNTCVCPERESGRCIRRCDVGGDCPGASSCRNHFPETSDFIVDGICVNDLALCSADTCGGDNDCPGNEICVHTGCGGGSFRCFPFSVF